MKTREEYENDYIQKYNLYPIGTRVCIIYPKCDEFMEKGTITDRLLKDGAYVWDYKIMLDNGKVTHIDHSLVATI